MNKKDLKKLKIDDSFVIEPFKFLLKFGIECSELSQKITIHDLHYILQNRLHHASVKNVSVDKIYRGDIILIGKPNNFLPYYNPLRYEKYIIEQKSSQEKETEEITNVEEFNMIDLYSLYQTTLELKYLNEIYDRTYASLEEELAPTRQKIYSRSKKTIGI